MKMSVAITSAKNIKISTMTILLDKEELKYLRVVTKRKHLYLITSLDEEDNSFGIVSQNALWGERFDAYKKAFPKHIVTSLELQSKIVKSEHQRFVKIKNTYATLNLNFVGRGLSKIETEHESFTIPGIKADIPFIRILYKKDMLASNAEFKTLKQSTLINSEKKEVVLEKQEKVTSKVSPKNKDESITDSKLEELEKAVGQVNFILGVLRKQGIDLKAEVKDGEIAIYRYIPAKKKRLV